MGSEMCIRDRNGEYAEIAGRVLTHFGGDSLPGNIATEAVAAAMTQFSQPVGPPVTSVKDGLWLMELIHGPTLAFKDFALAPLAEHCSITNSTPLFFVQHQVIPGLQPCLHLPTVKTCAR